MKVTIFALLVLLATKATAKSINGNVETIFERTFKDLHKGPPIEITGSSRIALTDQWIEQKLDNFNEADERKWQMRYLANKEFFQAGGPIFIFVGGEWEISAGSITSGHFVDMAKEHNGYLFYTEHRFYGKSKPTSDMSKENIKYLGVKQALADLAHFIRTMKSTIDGLSDSKVILAGGSYSATMVTWFKKLYPELATGCWASSAPLLAKANFYEYKEITGDSIKLVGGENCYNRIQNGLTELETLFANKRGAEVKAILKLCNSFDEYNDLDLWTLFSEISDIFAGLVQGHNDGNIQSACKTVMKGEDDLAGLAKYLLSTFGGKSCNDLTYKTSLGSIMDSSYSDNSMRQWLYQTCNEFGWYQTSSSRNQPFGTKFPLTLYTTMCADAYGEQFTNEFINSQIAATNELFGGLTPNVENVYISHGQLDPWRAMGIQNAEQATIVPLYAHCKDFNSISDKDTAVMRASKEKVADKVREWLKSE